MSRQLNQIKIDNGLYVDGTELKALTSVGIETDAGNLSEVTVTFLAEVDGLDNIKPEESYYEFTDEMVTKTGTVVEELTEEEKEQLKKRLKIKSPSEEWSKFGKEAFKSPSEEMQESATDEEVWKAYLEEKLPEDMHEIIEQNPLFKREIQETLGYKKFELRCKVNEMGDALKEPLEKLAKAVRNIGPKR